jgi:eukaryotic-like serine/threonine-protein kinase
VKDEELLLKSGEDKFPTSWSRDGRFLLFELSELKFAKYGLWVLPLQGEKKAFPFQRTEFNNYDGQFSPDGRWVAYFSDESGRDEIYVRTFSPDATAAASGAGGKWLISTGGGSGPRWRGDGKELYYIAPDGKLMEVDITTSPAFRAGVPRVLFQTPQTSISTLAYAWDVTPDGKRFLLPETTQEGRTPFTVVLNWQAGLKK